MKKREIPGEGLHKELSVGEDQSEDKEEDGLTVSRNGPR